MGRVHCGLDLQPIYKAVRERDRGSRGAEQFTNGAAFSLATKMFVNSPSPAVRGQVQEVFNIAYIRVIQIGVGFVGMGFILVFRERCQAEDGAGD